ncbi:hypothetical protein BJX64DRAFT_247601 [Aspergillus heterothallicus]
MPHKHKRRQNDANIYDLPPTLIAKALPVRDPSKPGKPKGKGKGCYKPQAKDTKAATKQSENAGARRKSARDDDTPAAFRRLMQFQEQMALANKKRKRSADDADDDSDDSDSDGSAPVAKGATRKNKTPAVAAASTSAETEVDAQEKTAAAPKILPGEKLSDFAARVDREMPLSNMKRSANPSTPSNLPKVKDHRTTKHEKHLRRLQAQWREDDVRIKEKEAAEREERGEEMEEQLRLWKEWEAESGKKKKRNPNASAGKQKKKGASAEGVEYDDGPDPWAKLKKKRAAVNPFDVAQEPPQLKKPREIFKVRGGAKVDVANVPASVGSLRRREELANERRNIVEEYRRLMAEKRQA